jgi:glycosyltransferase involved in cell wall biosynthesis
MVNADYTPQVKQEIPEIIWRHKFNIGFWFWELDVFPEKHMENLKYYDQIWVASKFVADSITMSKGYDGTPVHVIPIPLMRDVQHSGEIDGRTQPKNHAGILQSLLDELRDSFVFLTVFDFGSCGQRKNPAASIRAFLEAFPLEMQSSQSYRLVVKSHHGSPSEMDEMRALARNDTRIHFVSDILTDQEHTTLQKRADCFVSLHRSEGYGMNILEEMSNGIPVIVTNYSGNVDFFPPMNKLSGICVFPIPYRLVTLTTTLAVVYLEGNRWADPNHDSAVMAMRNVVRNDCKRKHGKEIAQLVWTNFGIKAVGNKIKRILRASWPEIQKKDISMKLAHETNPMILVGSEVASG